MAATAPVSLTAPATGLQLLPMMGFGTLMGQYDWGVLSTVGALTVVAVAWVLWWRDPVVSTPPASAHLQLAPGRD